MTDHDKEFLPTDPRQGTVEIVHEALIRHWARFQGWLSEDRKFRLWARRIEDKEREWKASGKSSLLLRRIELRESRAWLPSREHELLPSSRAYIKASFAAQRWRIAGVAAISLVVAAACGIWWNEHRVSSALFALQEAGFALMACEIDSKERACGYTASSKLNSQSLGVAAPYLSRIQWLRKLDLNGTKVGDIDALKGLTGLQTLDLSFTKVTDIDALKGLSGLQQLHLNSTQVSNIDALKGLTGLQQLYLDGTEVSDIDALKGLTGLQQLHLSATEVSDIDALKGLTGLQQLYLNNTQVSNIDAFKGLTGLQTLDLSFTKVTDIDALKGLSGLQQLHLNSTQVSNIDALKGLTGLQTLDIRFTKITDIDALKSALPTTHIDYINY